MDREQTLILTVLGDFLHNRRTVPETTEYDWESLFPCIRKHHLEGVVYCQLRDRIPEPYREQLRSQYMAEIVFYHHRKRLCQQLTELLEQQGMEYFYVKGDTVGAFYTQPALRSMCDVDLMVRDVTRRELRRCLEGAGFRCVEQGVSVWNYEKEGVTFEFHDALIESAHREDDRIAEYLTCCWDHVQEHVLDWNYHMIYLLLHLRKHFRSRGVGFRQFLDLAFVARSVPLDWKLIQRELEPLGLWQFCLTVMNLCQLWFGCACAPEQKTLAPDFVASATATIYQNGAFGFGNEENQGNELINTSRSEGVLALLRKVLIILFPSYQALCRTERYGFIRGKPFLLPFVWMYRIVLLIREGRSKKAVSDALQFSERVRSRNETYQEWGL